MLGVKKDVGSEKNVGLEKKHWVQRNRKNDNARKQLIKI